MCCGGLTCRRVVVLDRDKKVLWNAYKMFCEGVQGISRKTVGEFCCSVFTYRMWKVHVCRGGEGVLW